MKKNKQALLQAIEKGYNIIDNVVYYKNKIVNCVISNTYRNISIRISDGSKQFVPVHRLVAYKKFGDKIFEKGIHVRHLNNNCLDNSEGNIAIGTAYDNSMDRDPLIRKLSASKASIKYDHKPIIEFYLNCKSYKKTMEHFGIKSKGTFGHIIKNSLTKQGLI